MFEFNYLSPAFRGKLFEELDEFERKLRDGEDPDPEEVLAKFKGLERDQIYNELRDIQRFHNNEIVKSHSTIGKYESRALIGSGAHASIFKSFDPDTQREVALKLIHASPIRDQFSFRSLDIEVQAMSRLQHENIVQIYDAGYHEEQAFIVMQLVRGKTFDWNYPRMTLRERVQAFREIADAIAYIHENDVIHRDIKPSNILIDQKTGRAMLADFGIARLIDQTRTIQGFEEAAGSVGYMSPEQINSPESVGPETDVFSLGLVMHEALTLKKPFEGCKTPGEIMAKTINGAVGSVEANANLDVELCELISDCLAVKPCDRIDIKQVREKLGHWLTSETGPSNQHAKSTPGDRGTWRWIGVAAIAVAACAFVFWLVYPQLGREPIKGTERKAGNHLPESYAEGPGSIEFKIATVPTHSKMRIYPLLQNGTPDGSREFKCGVQRFLKLDPGYYFFVVECEGFFTHAIREVPKPGVPATSGSLRYTRDSDGTIRLQPIQVYDRLNRAKPIDLSSFVTVGEVMIEKDEVKSTWLNWGSSVTEAEKAGGCLIATLNQIESAKSQINDDPKIKEWTLDQSGSMKLDEQEIQVHLITNKGTIEKSHRFKRKDGVSFRRVRWLQPYSPNSGSGE